MDYPINEKIMVESKLNTSEKIAYEWLKKKYKYSFKDIIKSNKTPDFICNDGKRFEVKALYVNSIMFSQQQMNSLKDDDFIIVVDTNNKKIVGYFKWKDREKEKFRIYVPKQNYSGIKIDEETHTKFFKAKNLAEFKSEGRVTVSDFIEELLEPYFKKFDNLRIEKRE